MSGATKHLTTVVLPLLKIGFSMCINSVSSEESISIDFVKIERDKLTTARSEDLCIYALSKKLANYIAKVVRQLKDRVF